MSCCGKRSPDLNTTTGQEMATTPMRSGVPPGMIIGLNGELQRADGSDREGYSGKDVC